MTQLDEAVVAFSGAGILASAPRTAMLIVGRMFWGVGVGLADQAATIYSSEMAPPHVCSPPASCDEVEHLVLQRNTTSGMEPDLQASHLQ